MQLKALGRSLSARSMWGVQSAHSMWGVRRKESPCIRRSQSRRLSFLAILCKPGEEHPSPSPSGGRAPRPTAPSPSSSGAPSTALASRGEWAVIARESPALERLRPPGPAGGSGPTLPHLSGGTARGRMPQGTRVSDTAWSTIPRSPGLGPDTHVSFSWAHFF